MTSPRPDTPPELTHPDCSCAEGRAASTVSRRWFLGRTAALGAAGAVATAVGSGAATEFAFAGPSYTGDTVVVLSLRGGFDGLSAVAPVGDPGYAAARPSIAVPRSRALALDQMFGLHPALAPLLPLYRAGSLAFVHAVGQPSRTRSHFAALEEMETAAPGSHLRTGWIDRMAGVSGAPSTFSTVAVGGRGAPGSMRGPQAALVLDSLDNLTLTSPSGADEVARWATALRALHAAAPPTVKRTARATVAATEAARRVTAGAGAAAGTGYPAGELGSSLREVARMVKAGVGLRVATIDVGDWDMHAGLGTSDRGWMFDQLTLLGLALAAFAADLGSRLGDVTLVTLSEFGRRVGENGSGGVDHGHGNVSLVLGGGVVGGRVHGRWPGLAADQLDDGDLAGTTDYRVVLAEILEKRGRLATGTVFPELGAERLGLVRPRA